MKYLLDTNILSELNKSSTNRGVSRWYESVAVDTVYFSVMTLTEINKGILLLQRRDPERGRRLRDWTQGLWSDFTERILPITLDVATECAKLHVPDPMPVFDSFIAATALVHDLTLVTHNVKDFERSGVQLIDPFD